MIPIAGSAYTYSYATLGEIFAWIIGWDLILEYAVSNIAVASASVDTSKAHWHSRSGVVYLPLINGLQPCLCAGNGPAPTSTFRHF